MEQISGFPRNLAFNLKKLSGSIIKQKINIQSDKSSYNANDRVMINLPLGRMIDSRSIVATAKCTTNTNGFHFPRGGLNSLIENLQITANSRVIQSTQMYNYIWNCLADVSGYFSPEQSTKRMYENFDPSIAHTNVRGEGAIVTTNNANVVATIETYYFAINSFLGFLSSSAAIFDTNNIGQVQIIFTLSPDSVLWFGLGNTSATNLTGGTYKVEEFNLSMDTITFTNSLYYDLIKSKLEEDGLNIAYNDYLVSVGSLITKSSSFLTHTAQFSTNSLDMVLATFRPDSYNKSSVLLLANAVHGDASSTGSSLTYNEVIANPLANEGAGIYGGFNNSRYFLRDGSGINQSSFYINSQPMIINSAPINIFQNLLLCLDYANIDIASGGFHGGAITTGFYNRNYFLDALSLENLSGDNNNWVSGLGGNGGVIQIQYNYSFNGNTDKIYPIIIGKVTKVMNIKIGRNIDIME